jgi:hypothetical protein
MTKDSKCVTSFADSDDYVELEGKDALDLVIEYGDSLVDLSNLVSRKRLKLGNLKRSPVLKKQRNYRRLYPSESQVSELPDVSARDVLANLSSYSRPSKNKVDGPSLAGTYGYLTMRNQPTKDPPMKNSRYGDVASHDGGCRSSPSHYEEHPHYDNDPPAEKTTLQVEISPGVFCSLRGSDETWNAIEQGFSSHVNCFICCTALLCIADADYVLCPECLVVSPTGTEDRKMPANGSSGLLYQQHRGGVGLGLAKKLQPIPAAA